MALVSALVSALSVAIILPGPALGQGYPVIDSAAVAKAVDSVNALTQQVRELNDMLTQVQSIVQTVGKEGVPTLLFQEALSQSGISQYGSPVKDLMEQETSLMVSGAVGKSFKATLAEADKQKGQAGGATAKPDFSSLSSAEGWVRKELTVPKDASLTAIDLTRKARSMLAGEAAANGYAIALTVRQQVSAMGERAQKLSRQAGQSKDMRTDIAANTAVMLAMHEQLAEVQALLAAVLEVQSASGLADMDPTIAIEGGDHGPAGGGDGKDKSSPAAGGRH